MENNPRYNSRQTQRSSLLEEFNSKYPLTLSTRGMRAYLMESDEYIKRSQINEDPRR